MANVTYANRVDGVANNLRTVEVDLTLNASYATGGDTVPLATLGLRNVVDMVVLGSVDDKGAAVTPRGFVLKLGGTSAAPKVKLYNGSASEASAATGGDALGAVRVRFYGT